LLDLNPNSLATASRRIARYRPERYRADVLKPLTISVPPFQSVALTYLLHCLPGGIAKKAVAFDNLAPLLAPGGVVFGATLLSIGVERSAAARALMRLYNRKGVFSNMADSVQGLRAALDQRFRLVEIEIVGCAALFVQKIADRTLLIPNHNHFETSPASLGTPQDWFAAASHAFRARDRTPITK
jgi:hypothetical protein